MPSTAELTLLDEAGARNLTERIKAAAEQVWALLLEATEREAWRVLGYTSWREWASTEFGMSESRAYRLIDQGHVIRAIEEVTGVSPAGEITERAARDIKPHLEAVRDEMRDRVGAGEPPEVVVPEVIERHRSDLAERREQAQRDRAEQDEWLASITPEGYDPTADVRNQAIRIAVRSAVDEVARLAAAVTPAEVADYFAGERTLRHVVDELTGGLDEALDTLRRYREALR